MPEPWFHRRLPSEGEGYSVMTREGLLVVAAFIAVVVAGIVIPMLAGADAWTVYAIGVVVLLCGLALLMTIIRRHSDDERP